jgi:hypothetical protein
VPRTLKEAIRGPVIERGSPGFTQAAQVFNELFDDIMPSAIARPLDASDVAGAIRWVAAYDVPFRARSGGHSYAGYSTVADGVVVDLRYLAAISVDSTAGTATVGAGAELIDVYAQLARRGATIPAGSCPSIGVGGHALGGGFGLAARRFGLTADNLIAVEIVTADGQVRTANQQNDPDLLWALKGGGGGNFGVATNFTFKLHPLPSSAAYFNVEWPWSSADEAIAAWQAWAPHTKDTITSILHLDAPGPSINANGQYLGSADTLRALLGPLLSVPGATLRSMSDMAYLSLQLLLAGCGEETVPACHLAGSSSRGTVSRETFTAKSDYVAQPLPAAGRAAMIAAVDAPGSGSLLCDAYGGMVNRLAPIDTAFVHRDQLFCIQYYGSGSGSGWTDQAWSKMRPYVSGQAYQNYIDPDLRSWRSAYYGPNYERLVEVQQRIDPERRFTFPQAIG